ncbi:MAG: MBL fold metallo-hydrolase [Clostridia bacterium]|nr:MBL fold metallo-hydrolase [Clostridia bacterium]
MKIVTIKAKDTESGSQNTYLIKGKDCCILIDAGCSIDVVKKHTDLPIKAVLITHAHYDHIANIEDYDDAGIPIYISEKSFEILNDIKSNASDLFNDPRTFVIKNINTLKDEQEIDISGCKIKFYLTPGHTKDSGCYLFEKVLFSGDTLFSEGIGRVDLPTGSSQELKESLSKIKDIEYTNIYPGHGEISDKQIQDKLIPKWQRYLNIIR